MEYIRMKYIRMQRDNKRLGYFQLLYAAADVRSEDDCEVSFGHTMSDIAQMFFFQNSAALIMELQNCTNDVTIAIHSRAAVIGSNL